MKQSFIVFLALTVAFFIFSTRVFADGEQECNTSTGSYGQTSTTCSTTESTPVHQPVSAGVGDVSFWTMALILTIVGGIFFGAAKLSERVYWFD